MQVHVFAAPRPSRPAAPAQAPGATVQGRSLLAVLALARAEVAEELVHGLLGRPAQTPLQEGQAAPLSEFLRLVYGVAGLLADRAGSRDGALRRIGRAVVESFHREAPVVEGGQGPVPVSEAAFPALRALAATGEWAVLPTGASSLLLQVDGAVLPPAFFEGALRAELERRGLTGEVVARPLSPTAYHYLVSWLDPRARSPRS